MRPQRLAMLGCFCLVTMGFAQSPSLPERATNSPSGSEFAKRIASLDFTERENAIYEEITAGNVPHFLRTFCPVTNLGAGRTNVATFFAAPDYWAIGSDEDYFLTPMSPYTAQRLADRLGCTLPTRKMSDAIYAAASVKLAPSPIPPGPTMVTVPVFIEHNFTVKTQRLAEAKAHPLGALVAGDKKDVVITARLASITNRVAIYGWHRTNGAAIQPLYLGHTDAWVDYSHGIRFVLQQMLVNDGEKTVAEVLADPKLCELLSDEGIITNPRYPTNTPPVIPSQLNNILKSTVATNAMTANAEFKSTGSFNELVCNLTSEPGVKIFVNSPPRAEFAPAKPVLLIFYALPNGNTTEQTIGRNLKPGDDWHFNIQHIGAQTRWLRQVLTNRTPVVAYLEADSKSWPAWRKKNGDQVIPDIFASVKKLFATNQVEVVLAGHSGGGSLTFGYFNAVEKIPDDVTRIAFLDSNYAYSSTNHKAKLISWLKSSPEHRLCVLAYQDYLGLLDGKSFVSESGGTWGRSLAMLEDLRRPFPFQREDHDGLQHHSALDGRIQFFMKENPDHKILHTVQVERNGFIHALLVGTPLQDHGYEYLGERVYDRWISE